MDSTPQVSIGIPVYNGEKYLEKALASILEQTYSDFELIISDNASTDRTQEICLAYADRDPRIHYHRNEKNLGAAPNYNRAFELATGEYFKWADYDDLLAPNFLETCVNVLDQDPETVLTYPHARVIDENGQVLGDYHYKSDLSAVEPHIRFKNLVLKPDTAYQVSGVMRGVAVRKTGLHRSFPASDLVFPAELALQGKFFEIPEPLFFPRYHPEVSARLIPVERDRVTFFDTSYEGKLTLPKWQYLLAYLSVIHQAPIRAYVRAYCYIQMFRWVLMPDHFRALGKDVLIAGSRFFGRTLSARRGRVNRPS